MKPEGSDCKALPARAEWTLIPVPLQYMISTGVLLLPLSLRHRKYNQFVQVDMCFHLTATLLRCCYRHADYSS